MDRFRRGDLQFDVRDGGPVGGEPVVLLHGFPQDGTCWNRVVPALHDAGLRTLAPDQRGYSPGARPADPGAYTTSELADDVLALLDSAGLESAHVVGHDWGAAVAWTLAGRDPDRVRSLTALSVPHPAALGGRRRDRRQSWKFWYIRAFQQPGLADLLLPRVLARLLIRSGMNPETAGYYARQMQAPGAVTGGLNWYRALRHSRPVPVPSSPVPTTFVWGRKDFAVGRTAAEATADFVLADYRFVELDDGHWLPERRPGEMAQVILDRVRSTA